jgi:hypothetical protein
MRVRGASALPSFYLDVWLDSLPSYPLAGVENGSQCFCDTRYTNDNDPVMAPVINYGVQCLGDPNQTCVMVADPLFRCTVACPERAIVCLDKHRSHSKMHDMVILYAMDDNMMSGSEMLFFRWDRSECRARLRVALTTEAHAVVSSYHIRYPLPPS